MASFVPSYKTIEMCLSQKFHTTTKRTNTVTNQKVDAILRGNGVEANKIPQSIH